MTTENNNPDEDNEPPPVARIGGLAVSEWVTYSFIVLCVIAVIFGFRVGGERDAQAERAMAALAALTDVSESKAAAGNVLICDDRLLDPELLVNDYLTLSVQQAPIDEKDETRGYGPALFVRAEKDAVSGDTWDTTKRLMALVEEEGEKAAEASKNRDSRVTNPPDTGGRGEAAGSEADEKPENRLRWVRKRGSIENEEYLHYYILASEVATCSQRA